MKNYLKGLTILFIFIGLPVTTPPVFAQTLRVVSYNVENLFYPERDSLNPDSEYTPDGQRKWSYKRYYNKVENIARVLTHIGEWDGVDIIGLQEIENAAVVKRLCYTLRRYEYDFVHYDSPDKRGIDVALVYKKARIDTLSTRQIPVHLPTNNSEHETTRDIVYVCARADRKDTLHLIVCHMPSQRGGKAETEWKRRTAKNTLQNVVDSVLKTNKQAKIIVMGDMNSAPEDDLNGLTNRMRTSKTGTHKYHGQWTCLDQFYTSPALDSISRISVFDEEWIQETDEKYLGMKPKRTYNGFHYQNGFSDHLPIVLILK